MTAWVTRLSTVPGARCRLLCCAHAGGGPAAFRGWTNALPHDVELWAVNPPGREGRREEAAPASMQDWTEGVTNATRNSLGAPWVLFGHSFGGLVAYALKVAMHDDGVQCDGLVVAAMRAPQAPPRPPIAHLPDAALVARVAELGGIDPILKGDPELVKHIAAPLRADYVVLESSKYAQRPPMRAPLIAFRGEDDDVATEAEMAPWATLSTKGRVFVGGRGHFFPHDDPNFMQRLSKTLRDIVH
jgi:surfactin synthase thioesterase subunit